MQFYFGKYDLNVVFIFMIFCMSTTTNSSIKRHIGAIGKGRIRRLCNLRKDRHVFLELRHAQSILEIVWTCRLLSLIVFTRCNKKLVFTD